MKQLKMSQFIYLFHHNKFGDYPHKKVNQKWQLNLLAKYKTLTQMIINSINLRVCRRLFDKYMFNQMKLCPFICIALIATIVKTQGDDLAYAQTLPTLDSNVNARVNSVSYSFSGSRLITVANNTIQIWRRIEDETFRILQRPLVTSDSLVTAQISPDGLKIAAAGTDSKTYVWTFSPNIREFTSPQVLQQVADVGTKNITSLSFSNDNSRIVTGFTDGSFNSWTVDPTSGQFVFRENVKAHTTPVSDLRARSSKLVTAGGIDQSIKIWNYNAALNSYNSLPQTIQVGQVVNCVDMSRGQSLIAVGGGNGTIQTYNLSVIENNYRPNQTIFGANAGVIYAITVASDAAKIATTGADNTTSFWEIKSTLFTLTRKLNEAGWSLDFDRRNQLAIGLFNSSGAQTKLYNVVVNCNSTPQAVRTLNRTDCYCSPGTFFYSGQCLPLNCSLVAFSNGVTLSQFSCGCLPGYKFDNSLCLADCESVQNSEKLFNINNNTCVCLPGFEWINGNCIAPGRTVTTSSSRQTTTQIIPGGVITPGITTIQSTQTNFTTANGSGTGTVTFINLNVSTNCSNPSEVWNGTACVQGKLSCPPPLGSSDDGKTCNCLPGFYWNSESRSCFRNCSLIGNSTQQNIGPNDCRCLQNYTWQGNRCVPSISTQIINIIEVKSCRALDPKARTENNTCVCQIGYYWNKTREKCYRNCTFVNQSVGQDGNGGCRCSDKYVYSQSECKVPLQLSNIDTLSRTRCENISQAIRILQDPKNCACNPGFTWNNFSLTCVRQCDTVNFSKGVTPLGDGCYCIEGYTWDAKGIGSCVSVCSEKEYYVNGRCFPNCTRIDKAISNASNQSICNCVSGYFWSNNSCVAIINCSAITYASTNTSNLGICNCDSTYNWSNTTSTCVRNCSSIQNTNGSNPNNTNDCICNTGYVWNNSQCRKFDLCSNVSHSTGLNATDTSRCDCQSGYKWENNSCVMACSEIKNSVRSGSSCECANGYSKTDNNGTMSCVLNCSSMDYSNGETKDSGTQCKCRGGYRWNKVVGQCISKTKSNLGVALGVGLGVPLGILALLGLGGLAWYYLFRPEITMVPMTFLQTPSAAIVSQPSAAAYSTITTKALPYGTTSTLPPPVPRLPPSVVVQEAPITNRAFTTTYGNGPYVGIPRPPPPTVVRTLAQAPPKIIVNTVDKLPVTTTIKDGITTTTVVPPHTVQDNFTGAHSYLNFPFGADET